MRKYIEIKVSQDRASEKGTEELLKAAEEFVENIEHLLPKAEITIRYLPD